MKKRIRGLLALAMAFLLCALQGFAAAETLEEKVREFRLDNGLTFLVVERHEAPVAFMATLFNVGAANERPNITGISHLLEHMMFKGTEMMGTADYKKDKAYIEKTDELGERTIELRKLIGEWRFEKFEGFAAQVMAGFTAEEQERIGASVPEQNRLLVEKIEAMDPLPDSLAAVPRLIEHDGVDYLGLYAEYRTAWGEIMRLLDEQREFMLKEELWETYMNNGSRFLNAGTSNDFTVYFVYLPSNRLELFMVMESDRMESPVFREFWSERDVVMEERRLSENDPDDALDEAFNSVAFTASPYNWPVLGWMSDLQTIDRKELADYHRIYYAPNNAIVMIVGDVDVDEVRELAEKYYGKIPAQTPPPPVETREPEQQGERRVVVEHTANPKLMIGYHKPTFGHPDDPAFTVLQQILAGGRTSRLYKTVYEEKGLTMEPPRVYTGPGDRYDNLLVFSAVPQQPHTLEDVENAIYEEIDRLKTEPVSERELQRVKNQVDASQIRQMGSNLGIAFTIGMGQLYLGHYSKMFDYYDQIKEVTAGDLMRVAETYLTQKNRTVGHRVKIEKDDEEGGTGDEIDQQVLQAWVMQLPPEQQMEIVQKFQSMRSEAEAMAYAKELWERAKADGFVKEKPEETTEGE
ncbi:MAG TPA: insulinase family protein [Candidatus Eisenbacteria bacterium]|uniref:Insulinase family protein n=1 Tax=Eiseniibacteriota bacterium TaxID=2212470 RepID=A0A7V2F467_UNCEI|nr:insulinase family protein [Candidatus Eisenbacteria bacterium]